MLSFRCYEGKSELFKQQPAARALHHRAPARSQLLRSGGGPIFADEHFVYFQAQPDFVRKPMNRWPMAGKL
jgi:hypothetical protein